MQYVYSFLKLGDIHHSKGAARLPDANLSCTSAHIFERLPIGRFKSSLDLPQLEASFLPSLFRECQQIVVGRPYPTDLFFIVRTTGMYKILYAPAGACQDSPRSKLEATMGA